LKLLQSSVRYFSRINRTYVKTAAERSDWNCIGGKRVEGGEGHGSCIPTCTFHLQRGIEIDGWNIDWLPYSDSASFFHSPRDPATTFRILRSCMLVVRHPHVRRASPASTASDIPALLSPPSPDSLLQPSGASFASFYIRLPIDCAETFKLLCLSRNIIRCLLPVRFACNKANSSLFPWGYHDYMIHLCVPIAN